MRKLNRDIFLSGDLTLLTLFFAFFFDFWADSVIKLRQITTHRCYIPRGVLGTRVNGVGSSDTWSDKVGCWSDTCGRANSILIRIRADVEIFGSAKKNLRIHKYPKTCGRGLNCVLWFIWVSCATEWTAKERLTESWRHFANHFELRAVRHERPTKYCIEIFLEMNSS